MLQQRAKRGEEMRTIVLIVLSLTLPNLAMATVPAMSRATLPVGRSSSQPRAQVATAARAGIADAYLVGAAAAGHHVRQRLRLRRASCEEAGPRQWG